MMALELLAGPFPLSIDGAPAVANSSAIGNRFWVDDLGLTGYFQLVSGGGFYGIAQLDGVVHPRNNNPSISYGAGGAWDFVRADLLALATDGRVHEFRAVTGNYLDQVSPGVLVFGPSRKLYTRLEDRILLAWRGGIYTYAATDLDNKTLELQAVPYDDVPDSLMLGTITPGPRQGLVYVAWSSGQIVLYDTRSRTLAASVTGIAMDNLGIWYSRAYDIFVSLHQPAPGAASELRIWANEPKPTSISAPEAVDPRVQGRGTRLRARVTGSYGEPCPGHLVDWSVAGDGMLASTQSETDADGYASVELIAKLALSTGVATVGAAVLV